MLGDIEQAGYWSLHLYAGVGADIYKVVLGKWSLCRFINFCHFALQALFFLWKIEGYNDCFQKGPSSGMDSLFTVTEWQIWGFIACRAHDAIRLALSCSWISNKCKRPNKIDL